MQQQIGKNTKSKPKSKENLNQLSTLRTAHVCVCAYNCVQLSYTTQHRTVLIIFPVIFQTIVAAQMVST